MRRHIWISFKVHVELCGSICHFIKLHTGKVYKVNILQILAHSITRLVETSFKDGVWGCVKLTKAFDGQKKLLIFL